MNATARALSYESIESEILNGVLKPYARTRTDYLRDAWVEVPTPREPSVIVLGGRYCIPQSCYIDSTGHFNAVELVICFNQLAYATFGHLTYHGLLDHIEIGNCTDDARRVLAGMSFERYLEKQLSSMFILKTDVNFRGFIDPQEFYGSVTVQRIFFRRRTFFIKTSCEFHDEAGGRADGDILLAYPTHV